VLFPSLHHLGMGAERSSTFDVVEPALLQIDPHRHGWGRSFLKTNGEVESLRLRFTERCPIEARILDEGAPCVGDSLGLREAVRLFDDPRDAAWQNNSGWRRGIPQRGAS